MVLLLPEDAVAVPVLLDGIAGDVEHRGNLPVAQLFISISLLSSSLLFLRLQQRWQALSRTGILL